MRNKAQLILGGVLILFGILAVLSQLFQINFGELCWPVFLILLGVAILLRPRWLPGGTDWRLHPLGGQDRRGPWEVHPEETWSFVGEHKLDFTQAQLPEGETTLRLLGFVGDIDLYLPADFAYTLSASGFVTNVNQNGEKQDYIGTPYEYTSPDYAAAERKVRFELLYFVVDLNIHQF